MACSIVDIAMSILPSGVSAPVAAGTITAAPTARPMFQTYIGAPREINNPTRTVITDALGNWTIVLPWPSESDPTSLQWVITTVDGYSWQGAIPEGVAGPLLLHDLKQIYGWTAVASPSQFVTPLVIQGASGSASNSRIAQGVIVANTLIKAGTIANSVTQYLATDTVGYAIGVALSGAVDGARLTTQEVQGVQSKIKSDGTTTIVPGDLVQPSVTVNGRIMKGSTNAIGTAMSAAAATLDLLVDVL